MLCKSTRPCLNTTSPCWATGSLSFEHNQKAPCCAKRHGAFAVACGKGCVSMAVRMFFENVACEATSFVM